MKKQFTLLLILTLLLSSLPLPAAVAAEEIAYAAGCYGHYGDPSYLGGNDY